MSADRFLVNIKKEGNQIRLNVENGKKFGSSTVERKGETLHVLEVALTLTTGSGDLFQGSIDLDTGELIWHYPDGQPEQPTPSEPKDGLAEFNAKMEALEKRISELERRLMAGKDDNQAKFGIVDKGDGVYSIVPIDERTEDGVTPANGIKPEPVPEHISKEVEPKFQTWVRAINYPNGRGVSLEAEIELDGDATDCELISKLTELGYKLAGEPEAKAWTDNEWMKQYPPRPTLTRELLLQCATDFMVEHDPDYHVGWTPENIADCYLIGDPKKNNGYQLAKRLDENFNIDILPKDVENLDWFHGYVERTVYRLEKRWIEDNNITPQFKFGTPIKEGFVAGVSKCGRGYYEVMPPFELNEAKSLVKFEDAVEAWIHFDLRVVESQSPK